MVSLCAEVASAYFNLREAQQELSVLQRNALSQKAVVDITEVRYNTGLASKLDVAQAKSVYIVHWLLFLLQNPVLFNI